ncbi:MAG: SIS domain-containing protein [Deltaproteobacteria bacterium]|nr:SIS domain-containing protein [Deltaproteobacteria bacterium]
MLLKKIKSHWKEKGITGIYFGRNLATVPDGSLVLFPYEPNVLNCGITGVLAFKKRSAGKDRSLIQEIEFKLREVFENNGEKFKGDHLNRQKHYLGGPGVLREIKGFCEQLNCQAGFIEVFFNKTHQERLSVFCDKLERLIEDEENQRIQNKRYLTAEEDELIARRISDVRDILWFLKNDILLNVDKLSKLGRFDEYETTPQAVSRLKEINHIFNNLDRLEVRGRDSAGISILFGLDDSSFEVFTQELRDNSLFDEFETRQNNEVLSNRSIRTNRREALVFLVFTYKVAAEVGSLGDNVSYLREQVLNDDIFQRVLRLPQVYHSAVAHTRWASVGEISVPNCHPVDNDSDGSNGIIHVCLNGDIDNYLDLKRDYERQTGKTIHGEVTTDTKIIPIQIERYSREGNTLEESFRLAVSDFEGSHAIAMHSDLEPGKIFLAQKGSGQAIFVGLAEDHYAPASEIYGLVEQTSRYLKMDGEKVVQGISGRQTQGQIFILDCDSQGGLEGIKAMYYDGTPIELSENDIKETEITTRDIDRQHYPHYFLKEISESPRSIEQTIQGRLAIFEENGQRRPELLLDDSVIPPHLEKAITEKRIKKIVFIGQGTAGVAALGCAELFKYYLKGTDIQVAAVKASEFSGFMLGETREDSLVVAITQSGTTTDTNRAVDMSRERGAFTLAIVNRRDSDITFKVDGVLYTSSGRDIEMSVASTKAYYSQIVAGSVLGLRVAQLSGVLSDDFILTEIEQLLRLPSCMEKVLAKQEEIGESARKFAVTKKDWAVVGSGPNKISADEIRIKLSELCYKTISSDVVEDKKHIDLSAEPLIFVCAAGNTDDVVSDIVKDTAIFKAHQAVPIVVTTEGEHRFDPYADTVIYVPEIAERFAPIINTLAGHLWGYYAAMAINEESLKLFNFREEINEHVNNSLAKGLDIYEIVVEEAFRERAAEIYRAFKERIRQNRYATAMATCAAADITLLLKYLAGRLPSSDFEFDFGFRGTAPNMLRAFYECIGNIITEMARPIDAIKHQAKTVTVGTSRIAERVEGLLFEALEAHGFDKSHLTTNNILVLRRLQEVIREIKGTTLYRVEGLNILGEPVEETTIKVLKKEGSAKDLTSRAETDSKLRGTKQIIVRQGNVFIGKGKRDNRSILVIPIISTDINIDHLLLFNVGFKQQVEVQKKVEALGGKYGHIQNLVEEIGYAWKDEYLDILPIEDLFGASAEKISERIAGELKDKAPSNGS